MGTHQDTRLWSNWSGSVQCHPRQILKPSSVSELRRMVKEASEAGLHVRVVGAGHSFTPLVQTEDVLLSLDALCGLKQVDTLIRRVTVFGGTRLKELGEALLSYGLSQENLGDIDVQSIAGAISTGTHGTGISLGTLSTQVEGLTLVTADGDILECSHEQNSDIFTAALVSLGTLGVIAEVKLRVVPARRLHFISQRRSLEDCLTHLEQYQQEHSHFEFFWLPYTNWTQTKFLDETTELESKRNLWSDFNKIVLENGVYWLLSEACRLVPPITQSISKFSAQAIARVEEVQYSHRLFATPRMVRFQEMEYNIPREHLRSVLKEIRTCIDTQQFNVHFPIECRFVHSDAIWLSPAYQRDSAYVAVHMYRGMAYQDYFQHVEAIFRRYEGRPHWGKMHTRTASELATLYPKWQAFQQVRSSLDPNGVFLNPYLRTLFGCE